MKNVKIGVTGNLGSGKTTFSEFLRKLGNAEILSLDDLGREITFEKIDEIERASGLKLSAFPTHVRGREIGKWAFSSPENLTVLNKVVHPELKKRAIDRIKNWKDGILIVDGALIFELGIANWLDKIITVTAPIEIMKERFLKKSGYPEGAFRTLIGFQWPQEKKAKLSDYAVDNSRTLEDLKREAKRIFRDILRDP